MNVRLYSYREVRGGERFVNNQVNRSTVKSKQVVWCEAGAAGSVGGRAECTWTGVKQVIRVVRYYRRLLMYPASPWIIVWIQPPEEKTGEQVKHLIFLSKVKWAAIINKASPAVLLRHTCKSLIPLQGFCLNQGGRRHHCGPPLCHRFILWLLNGEKHHRLKDCSTLCQLERLNLNLSGTSPYSSILYFFP